MTVVGRVGGGAPAVARRAAATGGAFAVEPGAGAVSTPMAAEPMTAVGGLLLLQQVDDGPTRDRQARRYGRAMLDGLAALQRALLGGDDDPGALDRLAALVEHCPDAADPALRATLAAVALRARVELARREL